MIRLDILGLIGYVIASTTGVTLIKMNLERIELKFGMSFFGSLLNPGIIAGVSLYVIGFLLWIYVLSQMKLSIAYPVAITLSVLAVIATSAIILREKISLEIVIGILFCLLGIFIMVRNAEVV